LLRPEACCRVYLGWFPRPEVGDPCSPLSLSQEDLFPGGLIRLVLVYKFDLCLPIGLRFRSFSPMLSRIFFECAWRQVFSCGTWAVDLVHVHASTYLVEHRRFNSLFPPPGCGLFSPSQRGGRCGRCFLFSSGSLYYGRVD